MLENTLLVTSIAPHNIENQHLAIESWLRLGFSVTSLNTQSDVDDLKPLFGGVEFVAVHKDVGAEPGRPQISLNDVIGFLDSRGSPVCGLIKPDIHLQATPVALQFIIEEAKGSLVYASRTDVNSLDDATGDICKSSFDVFLFDHEILKAFPSTELCLGQSWWDLWLAYCLIRAPGRFPLKFVAFRFATHLVNGSNCEDGSAYDRYGMHFAKFLDQGTHDALLAQPPEMLRKSLEAISLNVAMAILFESRWLSCFPE